MKVEGVQVAHLQPEQEGAVTEVRVATTVSKPKKDPLKGVLKVENILIWLKIRLCCGKEYVANSSTHGTTNLGKDLKMCLKNPYRVVDKKNKRQ